MYAVVSHASVRRIACYIFLAVTSRRMVCHHEALFFGEFSYIVTSFLELSPLFRLPLHHVHIFLYSELIHVDSYCLSGEPKSFLILRKLSPPRICAASADSALKKCEIMQLGRVCFPFLSSSFGLGINDSLVSLQHAARPLISQWFEHWNRTNFK